MAYMHMQATVRKHRSVRVTSLQMLLQQKTVATHRDLGLPLQLQPCVPPRAKIRSPRQGLGLMMRPPPPLVQLGPSASSDWPARMQSTFLPSDVNQHLQQAERAFKDAGTNQQKQYLQQEWKSARQDAVYSAFGTGCLTGIYMFVTLRRSLGS